MYVFYEVDVFNNMFLLYSPCSVLVSVLPFALVGIGFDTERTEPFFRNWSAGD